MSVLDLIVRGGTVVDGSGSEGFSADVGVANGRIVEIGKIASNGAREIDADGLIVTPGFVDGHTHMDAQLHWDPLGTNSCWHGVTTAVMGNCGFTIAPMRKGQQALVARNLERAEDISGAAMDAGIDWRWEGFADYLDVVDQMPKGINYATYVGHSALRTWAMGERAFAEAASDADLEEMKGEVSRAMKAGAIGFSTSRSDAHETADDRPVASRIADRREVEALVGQLKGHKGAMFELAHEHVGPDPRDQKAYDDWLIRITGENDITTTYGVIGSTWRDQFGVMERAAAAGIRMVGQTHSRGVTTLLSFQTTTPFDGLPEWQPFRAKPLAAQAADLRDPATRAILVNAARAALESGAVVVDWNKLLIYDKPLPPFRTVSSLAQERGQHPVDVIIDEALKRDLVLFVMQRLTPGDRDDLLEMMRHPLGVVTFSDAGAHVSQIADASIQSHLFAYWQRDQGEFTLPETIEMITRRPAEAWGFTDRGLLRPGFVADLNILDPNTYGPEMPQLVHDLPTGARRLAQKSSGIRATIVGGEVLIENGAHTGALPGKLLRRLN